MKIPFWSDPNDNIQILEATKEETDDYGHRFGSEYIRLRPEHIKALQTGKILAWHDSEYTTFVVLSEEDEEDEE